VVIVVELFTAYLFVFFGSSLLACCSLEQMTVILDFGLFRCVCLTDLFCSFLCCVRIKFINGEDCGWWLVDCVVRIQIDGSLHKTFLAFSFINLIYSVVRTLRDYIY
jgi:hypothetical protein